MRNNYSLFSFWPGIGPLLLLTLLSTPASGQETKIVRDLKVWTGAAIEKSFGSDWKISLEEEVRLQKNATMVGEYFTEMGIEYKVDKNISLETAYRFARNRKMNNAFENRSRYNVDLNYEGNTYSFSFRARVRYQKEIEGMQLLNTTIPYEKYFRTRAELRYTRLGSVVPYIHGELFQLYEMFEHPVFDKYRVMAGLRLDAGSFGEFNVRYGIIRELNTYMPYTFYLLKMKYTFEF